MASAQTAGPVSVADIPNRSALIAFGSETGNSQDAAEEVAKMATRLHFTSRIHEMDAIKLSDLPKHTLVILVISTTGQGDMPQNSLAFWKSLLRKKLLPGCLRGVRFTTFGLGDSSYPKFNWAARKLHKRLEQLGAAEFYPRGEGDEQDDDGIDEAFLPWLADLRTRLLEQFPLPANILPIPDDALLPSRYTLSIDAARVDTAKAGFNVSEEQDLLDRVQDLGLLQSESFLPTNNDDDIDKGKASRRYWADVLAAVPQGLLAVLQGNDRMTPEDHWQDVRRLSFRLHHTHSKSLNIHPGDCLRLYPRNSPEDVERLVRAMSWEDVADKSFELASARHDIPTGLFTERFTTLRRLLTQNLDITAIPRRGFLESISHHSTNPDQKERLLEFTKPEYIDEYYDYATRPRRTILEVLEEFHSVKIPAAYALDVFPVMRGRDFSIASIRRTKTEHGEDAYMVELLVALVKYQTVLRKIRTGLCSRYLAPLAPGTPVLATHKPSITSLHGPINARRPLCAIATGTGIAPTRALIQERLQLAAAECPVGPSVLFFGNRSRDKDYFFADEWAAVPHDRLLVFTAFSRDQREKVYVQDAIRQHSDIISKMVADDAIFMVCGGSTKMAMACREAIIACIKEGGVCDTEADAQRLFEGLTWWQEIW